jgi:hypothetical protein
MSIICTPKSPTLPANRRSRPAGRNEFVQGIDLLAAPHRAGASMCKPFERPVLLQVTVYKEPRAARS